MPLQRIVAPTQLCVTVPQARLHCRVDGTNEDLLIVGMIRAATREAEGLCQRAAMQQTWRLSLDCFESQCLQLRMPPVTAVDAVRYAEASTGVMTTLAPSAYQVELSHGMYGRIAPAVGVWWPATRAGQLGAVQVDFKAGWATTGEVPELFAQWVLMRVGAYYENREAWTQGRAIERNEFIDQMLMDFRTGPAL